MELHDEEAAEVIEKEELILPNESYNKVSVSVDHVYERDTERDIVMVSPKRGLTVTYTVCPFGPAIRTVNCNGRRGIVERKTKVCH